MQTKQPNLITNTFVFILFTLSLTFSQDADTSSFSGYFRAGFRAVDVGGAMNKYQQHINLERGPRLFDLNMQFTPANGLNGLMDRADVYINNFGGDPFEILQIGITKFGAYDFTYQRRKATYYYNDTILPHELANPLLANAGDFHTFDFDRIIDSGNLQVALTQNANLNLSFHRFTKFGENTTTIDISRDEFEFHQPVDETKNEYILAADYTMNNTTIVLEERIRDYENNYSLFLPGFSVGENPNNFTELNFFFFEQPYDFKSYTHTARIISRPINRLTIRAAASIENLRSEIDYAENASGIGFDSTFFDYFIFGGGDIDRDLQLYDLDATIEITDRLAAVGAFRYRTFDQSGEFNAGAEINRSEWDFNTTSVEAGLQYLFPSNLSVTGGFRLDNRNVDIVYFSEGEEVTAESPDTRQTGFFGNASWRPSRMLQLTADYQFSAFDDPFTLTSATDLNRFRGRIQYRLLPQVTVSGSALIHRVKNDDSGWTADQNNFGIRLAYSQNNILASAGYNRITIQREIIQEVMTVGFGGGNVFIFPADYEATTNMFDGQFRWQFNSNWSAGGNLVVYENRKSWPLSRLNVRGYLEYIFPTGYLIRAAYRYADFEENENPFDDYNASIVEISVGYNW